MKQPERLTLPITDLKTAGYNPRKISKTELQKLANSIKQYGLVQPIIINTDNTIIGGHQRVAACRLLGMEEVDVYRVHLPEDDEKALNVALNKIGGKWEENTLADLLKELAEKNKLALTGFKHDELERLRFKQGNQINRSLIEDYIVPPFSVLDAKQGYWQDRKKQWVEQIGDGAEGRDDDLQVGSLKKLGNMHGSTLTATSIFDPVLTEIMYTWYVPEGGTIADPFSGGATRGLVASRLGYKYVGTDVSERQINANKAKASDLGEKNATWHLATGAKLGDHVQKADLVFTCPPYYNLEVYDAENPLDISGAPTYEKFLEEYGKILAATYDVLKADAWAIIVVGNIRNADGYYHNLVGDTVRIMENAGYRFYNDAVLATAIGTASVRARNTFKHKKLVKTHQNILYFTKGKEVKINPLLATVLDAGLPATAHQSLLVFKR